MNFLNLKTKYKLYKLLKIPFTVKILVFHDSDANVFVATSPDVEGLVLEAETFKQLKLEVEEAVINLLSFDKNSFHHSTVGLNYIDQLHIA